MHPGQMPLRGDFRGKRFAIAQRFALEHHLGAVALGRRDLDQGGRGRHDDGGRDVQQTSVVGDGLRMITRRHGDHALGSRRGRQDRKVRQRAAFLERAGHLQVLVFDEDLRSGQGREPRRRQQRRAQNRAGNGAARLLDGRERDLHRLLLAWTRRPNAHASAIRTGNLGLFAEALDLDHLARGDPVLLPACRDNGFHRKKRPFLKGCTASAHKTTWAARKSSTARR